jgi:hypothetical protein
MQEFSSRTTLARSSRRVRWGCGLLALAYFWAGHPALLSLVHGDPAAAGGMLPGTALVVVALVAVEILIVLVPLRRGEVWAFGATLLPVVLVAIPRMLTDPKCKAMSLSVHGCHQFMGAILLAIIGLALAFPYRLRAT